MKKGYKRIVYLVLGAFLSMMAVGVPVEAAFDFSGSWRSDLAARQYELPVSEWKYGNRNTLRLNFKDSPGPAIKMEGSFDLLLLAGDDADAYPGQEHSFFIQDTRFTPVLETRKLYLSLFFDQCTFTLGRQIINYGVGYVFSPVDCFSAVNLQDPGLSRKGSDIIRVRIPLGDLAGIEGVTTVSTAGTNSASAVKVFGNLQGFDWSLTGIYKHPQEETLVGLSFKGDILLGVYGELVEHYGTLDNTTFFEGMAGVDYSFEINTSKLLLSAEYYYNGNPVNPNILTPEELLALNRIFLGEEYLFCQANYVYDEIRNFALNGIYNLAQKSWAGTLLFSYNIRQNTNLIFNTRYYSGDLNGRNIQYGPKAELGASVEVRF